MIKKACAAGPRAAFAAVSGPGGEERAFWASLENCGGRCLPVHTCGGASAIGGKLSGSVWDALAGEGARGVWVLKDGKSSVVT